MPVSSSGGEKYTAHTARTVTFSPLDARFSHRELSLGLLAALLELRLEATDAILLLMEFDLAIQRRQLFLGAARLTRSTLLRRKGQNVAATRIAETSALDVNPSPPARS